MLDKVKTGNLIVNPATYADETEFHRTMQIVRRDDPMMWVEPDGYRPFWVISKHVDIREVESQPARFLNRPRSFLLTAEEEQRLFAQTGEYVATRSVVQVDGEEHKLLRQATQAWFMPVKVAALESRIRDIARGLVDEMATRTDTFDFVRDIALWYPLRVIMLILGLPQQDAPLILAITQQTMSANDPDTAGQAGLAGILDAQAKVAEYFARVTAQRRANPQDDVSSVIANATIGGRLLTDLEATSYYLTLATAGHDTTSSTVAGAMRALIENPDQLALLKADPTLIRRCAVDEFLRWTSPIKHFFRTASEDYVLRGNRIRAGENLMMSYPSANRDEDIFDAPFSFRVDRKPNSHMAFGFGPHLCLGMHLAKLELRTFFEELLPRLTSAYMTAKPQGAHSNFVQGLKRMPVRMSIAPGRPPPD
jgi:cytochrome P450